jgi:glutaredoxin 3
MSKSKRKIEIFTAGCPACEDLIAQIRGAACPSCAIDILDMGKPEVAARARREGIHRLPAVVIDGELASCCADRGPNLAALEQLGLGRPK